MRDVTRGVSKSPLIHLAAVFSRPKWQTPPGCHSTKTFHYRIDFPLGPLDMIHQFGLIFGSIKITAHWGLMRPYLNCWTVHLLFPSLYTHTRTEDFISWMMVHHDDVIKWKIFPRYWPFVRRIDRSPVNSPHKGQWRGALMFSLICFWINDWVNNRETGHYDVIIMIYYCKYFASWVHR